jgi:isochorismate hydrolase
MAHSRGLNPSKCALIIVDMQKRFDPIAKPIASQLANFGEFCLERKIPVIMTMHHDKPDEETELIKFWGDEIRIVKGSYDWSFISEMEVLSKEKGVTILDDKIA